MKGQTQALTAVLITSVTVGAVATAFVWGKPLLEKRQNKAQLDQVERDVFEFQQEIVSVAQSGSDTTAKVDLELENGRLTVNPEQDYIQIQTQSSQVPYVSGTWELLSEGSSQNLTVGTGDYGRKGEDPPGAVAVKAAAGAGSTVVEYRVEFRNLRADTPSGARLEKIDITSVGKKSSTGETTILITNEGTSEDSVKISSGEKLDRKLTRVSVDIR